MIRFIDLGKQLALEEDDPEAPRHFCFYDTVRDVFVRINGWVIFESMTDLMIEMEADECITADFANRLISLMPSWATRIKVEAPRYSVQVFGFKM